MSQSHNSHHAPTRRLALELAVRDSLDGLQELASEFAYRSNPHVMEILSIEPPGTDPYAPEAVPAARATTARLVRPTQAAAARSTDVVAFLIERERLSA